MASRLGLGSSLSVDPVGTTLILGNTYSVVFDGTDDYISTAFQPDFIHTNATLSFWCSMANFSGSQVLGCHNSKRFYCGFYAERAFFGVQDAYKDSVDISSYIATDTWMNITLVANSGTASYYINGVSRATKSYTQSAGSNPDVNFLIGAWAHPSAAQFMEGYIDEVAVFDSALSAGEIVSIYNGGKPQSLASYNPVAWWRMGDNDGGTGSTITDQGSGGNNGTLTNGASIYPSVP